MRTPDRVRAVAVDDGCNPDASPSEDKGNYVTEDSHAATGIGCLCLRARRDERNTKLAFTTLVEKLEAAVKSNRMAIASASEGAKAQGFSIAGNRVVGVYRNDFARRMLQASVAAGIEAPLRFYVTENPDGTATLSYKTPTAVFSPYFAEAADLRALARELDGIFEKIAGEAAHSN